MEPAFVVTGQALVVHGVVDELVIVEAIAAEVRVVGVEDVLVGSLFDHESIACVAVAWAEVEEEVEVSATEGEDLVAVVVPYLHDILLLEAAVLLEHLEHGCVEVAEIVEAELFVIDEVPLAACILVAPSVAFAWEVYPFGMSELIAHEVEVTAVDGAKCDEAYHLVEGDASIDVGVLVSFLEVPVHVAVDESEDDGLVSDECLVVALAVGDGLLVLASVGEFPEDGAGFPVFVALFLDNLYPVVGDVHGQSVVEAVATVLEGERQSRHSAHFFGYGDGVLVD